MIGRRDRVRRVAIYPPRRSAQKLQAPPAEGSLRIGKFAHPNAHSESVGFRSATQSIKTRPGSFDSLS
jgi:hypothetical protein